MKIQQLVIERLTNAIEDGGGTATVETDWANTGYVMALNEDLDIEWAIRYDFQTTYFSLKLYKGSPQAQVITARASTISDGAVTSEAIAKIVDGMTR